uniref:Uncharacterized protein n=1 Tax=Arundo donax TaxID=35708 RepID=A0A0A9HN11_ARUDO
MAAAPPQRLSTAWERHRAAWAPAR